MHALSGAQILPDDSLLVPWSKQTERGTACLFELGGRWCIFRLNALHITVTALALRTEEFCKPGQRDPAISLAAQALALGAVHSKRVAPVLAAPVIATTMVATNTKLEELREGFLAAEAAPAAIGRPAWTATFQFQTKELALPYFVETAVGGATPLEARTACLLGHKHLLELAAWHTPAMLEEEPQSAEFWPRGFALKIRLALEAASCQSVNDFELWCPHELRVVINNYAVPRKRDVLQRA